MKCVHCKTAPAAFGKNMCQGCINRVTEITRRPDPKILSLFNQSIPTAITARIGEQEKKGK